MEKGGEGGTEQEERSRVVNTRGKASSVLSVSWPPGTFLYQTHAGRIRNKNRFHNLCVFFNQFFPLSTHNSRQ